MEGKDPLDGAGGVCDGHCASWIDVQDSPYTRLSLRIIYYRDTVTPNYKHEGLYNITQTYAVIPHEARP
jgi:hypothetical protein